MKRLRLALLLIAAWAFCSHLGALPLLDDPNEGEYAEVAREMIESGEWSSPQLNYVLFLNKPPLTYWLIAASYLVFGVNEFAARLPIALTALLIVFLLSHLGTLLFADPRAVQHDIASDGGLLAGWILLTSAGFFVEAHLLRPDLVQTAAMTGSFLALAHLCRGVFERDDRRVNDTQERNSWALIGWQVGLAAGLMSKGMVAILIPAGVCLGLSVFQRSGALLQLLLHPRAWWLFLALIAPWHLIMSLRHAGFLWDYVINQHLLFFFDRKWPRDSVPVSLTVFWAAFAMRLFPWVVFLPPALWSLCRDISGRAAKHTPGTSGVEPSSTAHTWPAVLLLLWLASILLLFSAAASRMEHYSILALPPAALLLAKLFADYGRTARHGTAIATLTLLLAFLMLASITTVPQLIGAQPWLAAVGDFIPMARSVFMILASTTVVAAVLAMGRRPSWRRWVAPCVGLGFLAIVPFFLEGLTLLSQINSSAPLAAQLQARLTPHTRVVYEAPVEYQSSAGFNFYLRRKLDLLAHADFVPPPYLAPYMGQLYLDQPTFETAWQDEDVLLITDPLRERRSAAGVAPGPAHIIARDYCRLLISNQSD